MGRLPTPVIQQVMVEPDEDTEKRKKTFYQIITLAIVKSVESEQG